jgi:DNA-binding beta-propeller fold protein YncE
LATSGTVFAVDGDTNTILATIPLALPPGTDMRDIVVNPNNNTVYALDGAGNVYEINGNTNAVIAVIPVPIAAPITTEKLAFDVANNTLYVTGSTNDANGKVVAIDAANNAVTGVYPAGEFPIGLDVINK